MIDIKSIRENPKLVKDNIRKKNGDVKLVDSVKEKDEELRKLMNDGQKLRNRRNEVSKKINELKKKGKSAKKELDEAKEIPGKINKIEEKQEKLKKEIIELMLKIPNIMDKSVPLGKDETENKVIKKVGKPKKFNFEVKNHVELIEDLGLADFDASAKTSGNGFYFLKGDLALLNQALIRFTIEHMQKKGYLYIEPPLMLHKDILAAALDMSEFEQSVYQVNDDDLCLIGTSEYSLLGMLAGKLVKEDQLPLKLYSYSMCFRKEVGSHGINERGLWRTHQFNKVEQFVFCSPGESGKYYDEMLKNSEELFQKLEIPYRVLEMCSGDLALWKAKSADIEVYRPTTKDYGEVCSLSNCTDFQARNLNIRVERKDGKREILHTLNNTALATSRALVAIIENYQNIDGSITVPKILVPYMVGKKVIKKS
ncbi:serine--tRNA ligase [Candidatus Woesearchaeota archaeon]|nr:serine--tRNA ligase [Candidatus Woesearchaeota archaeon]